MKLPRRQFLAGTGAAVAAGAVPLDAAAPQTGRQEDGAAAPGDWDWVRRQFALSDDMIHMSAMLLASHPRPVRDAIERHRQALDADPVRYLEENNDGLTGAAREAAGRYLGTGAGAIALTDSTTMGIGLVYNGLRLREGHEILSTDEDYFVTHAAIRQASERTGASVRKLDLHDGAADATVDALVGRIADAIRPETRVLAVTWVHSSTGLKLPLAQIGAMLAEVNAQRGDGDRVIFCVDGVHGFGVEDATLEELGCDFLMAGCHKWLFGPRGTGIVAGTDEAWATTLPSIPSFIEDKVFDAWLAHGDPPGPTTAAAMTPGGFKPFEHRWAMTEAFGFQEEIGKARVAERTYALAGQLKEGLATMPHVVLHTPRSPALSAGIVSFDVDGLTAPAVVGTLRDRGIVASVTPYAVARVRLTPSIRNTPAEIETALDAIGAMGG